MNLIEKLKKFNSNTNKNKQSKVRKKHRPFKNPCALERALGTLCRLAVICGFIGLATLAVVSVCVVGYVVSETNSETVILSKEAIDLSQTTNGHTLVIPKKHFKNFLEVDDDTLAHMIKVTKDIANKIVTKLNANGVNILTNANEVAGQTVMHFHLHIIPRYDNNDQIEINFSDRSNEVNLDSLFNQIME